MNCRVCGSTMHKISTDLPFKVTESTILILKSLPVIQCDGCGEFLIEDAVMERVDAILEKADTSVELEIVRYAA
jgi:YgiT-type zinc finger domain-containing protein